MFIHSLIINLLMAYLYLSGKYKLKIRNLIHSVENEGREFPSLFLRPLL